MGTNKTPGNYVVEKDRFPNSVVQITTSIPVFIGYTEKVGGKNKRLLNKPVKINSMDEYVSIFGAEPQSYFTITKKEDNNSGNNAFSIENYTIQQSGDKYSLYFHMLLFFQNGGGTCYVVSVGDYQTDYDAAKFLSAIEVLKKEPEPTMLVIPELVNFGFDDYATVQQHVLAHCGESMKNRIAILDVYDGYKDRTSNDDVISRFREGVGGSYLSYGSAYYPWINTSMVSEKELSFLNIDRKSFNQLKQILSNELIAPIDESIAKLDATKNKDTINKLKNKRAKYTGIIANVNPDILDDKLDAANKSIIEISSAFPAILHEIKRQVCLLPPSAAMAGIYTMVADSMGVWKAPANLSLISACSPSVTISHTNQQNLNMSADGKSINSILLSPDNKTLIYGARTLDGNSSDWRYINVRRTMIMIEQSIRIAMQPYVFEPNTANTWIVIKELIADFLIGIWKKGGLAGTTPAEAFNVRIGLGETMTSDDIENGILRVNVLVAPVEPARFIELTITP